MSEEITTPPSSTGSIEGDLAQAIISILETTNSPAIQRAREIIAHRLAISGDIAPSRIPAPRNITEIGGYINLLTEYEEIGQRSRMLAAILGIAGPQVNLPQPGALPPLAFGSRSQVRPDGPQQATFPLAFTMRSDFLPAFDEMLSIVMARGAAVPVLSPMRMLPGATMLAPTNGTEQLDLIGRVLTLAPTAALRDPSLDPMSLSRPTAGGAFEVLARVFDTTASEAITIPDGNWTSWQCDITQCLEVDTTDARFALTPLLNTAGWHQTATPINPVTVTDPGDWNVWRNITGLVPGVTRFGDELQLLYTADVIVGSSVFEQLDLVWNGMEFATP